MTEKLKQTRVGYLFDKKIDEFIQSAEWSYSFNTVGQFVLTSKLNRSIFLSYRPTEGIDYSVHLSHYLTQQIGGHSGNREEVTLDILDKFGIHEQR